MKLFATYFDSFVEDLRLFLYSQHVLALGGGGTVDVAQPVSILWFSCVDHML
jgi:hypothetical protein